MKTSRWFDPSRTRLVVLSPTEKAVSNSFQSVDVNDGRYRSLLAEMQRFRGGVYLRDEAIDPSALTTDGRHRLEIDERSWHLLAIDSRGEVCGCARYLPHQNTVTFQQLWVRNSALTASLVWGSRLQAAIGRELQQARQNGLSYVEVGGWAISEERRWTCDALRLALSTFGLARLLGGCLGITTATVKHSSSSILRRIGGRPLAIDGEELPEYYDPRYRCQMEMLRFDSRYPDQKYCRWIQEICERIAYVQVICGPAKSAVLPALAHWPAEPELALA